MTEAQMAFLAERRRERDRARPQPQAAPPLRESPERSNNAPSPGEGSARYNGYGAFIHDDADDDVNGPAVSQLKVEDCWRFLIGPGTIGEFLVCRHVKFGTVVELYKDSAGGFSMQREQGALVKYCSALCSMQDESKPFAPQIVQRLSAGEGSKLAQGTHAGAWGAGIVRANRVVFKTRVKGREGEPEESAELYLTVDGFVFLSAGGFKCIAVRAGEFMPELSRLEAHNLLKESMESS